MSVLLVDTPLPRVHRLTLNRPEKRNALNNELRGAIFKALEAHDNDPEVKVTIVRGAGPGTPRARVEARRWTCRPSALGAHRSSLVPPPVAVPVAACRAGRSSIVRNGVVLGPSPRRTRVR